MKTIEYYMSLPYKLEIVPDLDEGGYVASYPELPGCITVGETVESVAENATDAKMLWLEADTSGMMRTAAMPCSTM